MTSPYPIESLLSAHLYMSPALVGERLYFISDLSGRLSLYAMARGGEPERLIPAEIALQHPHHLGGKAFCVLPAMGKILLMIDQDGDENYQPHLLPIRGGTPEPLFGERFAGQKLECSECDEARRVAVFSVDPRSNPHYESFLADLDSGATTSLGSSVYGNSFVDASDDFGRVVLTDMYSFGDEALFLWRRETGERELLFGKPLGERAEGETVPLLGLRSGHLTPDGRGLLIVSSLFEDQYGLALLPLDDPDAVRAVEVVGTAHEGVGEMTDLTHLEGARYLLTYNIDGSSFVYEGVFDEGALRFEATHTLVGSGDLAQGVLDAIDFDEGSGDIVLSFSTATRPPQLYTLEGPERRVCQQTHQQLEGIPEGLLAAGEEASYTSHDGLRVSARLYLPDAELGHAAPYPVIFYIHGGPQGQERPDFTWFSMPLIQFFTLNGFAVWVPNVRGSQGYGIEYMKRVDHDWGGQDRLDHIAAFDALRGDARLDLERVGVMGRSYGGYMTLTLAGRHPDRWKGAVDLFGPYNLFTFMDRLPETWKTYFHHAVGHPERDHDFLVERSPSTYLHQLACPLLVIQGANDPRVVERESRDVVEQLREQGKTVEYLVFDNEGHDVLKFENKVRCYNAIVDFFKATL